MIIVIGIVWILLGLFNVALARVMYHYCENKGIDSQSIEDRGSSVIFIGLAPLATLVLISLAVSGLLNSKNKGIFDRTAKKIADKVSEKF